MGIECGFKKILSFLLIWLYDDRINGFKNKTNVTMDSMLVSLPHTLHNFHIL